MLRNGRLVLPREAELVGRVRRLEHYTSPREFWICALEFTEVAFAEDGQIVHPEFLREAALLRSNSRRGPSDPADVAGELPSVGTFMAEGRNFSLKAGFRMGFRDLDDYCVRSNLHLPHATAVAIKRNSSVLTYLKHLPEPGGADGRRGTAAFGNSFGISTASRGGGWRRMRGGGYRDPSRCHHRSGRYSQSPLRVDRPEICRAADSEAGPWIQHRF